MKMEDVFVNEDTTLKINQMNVFNVTRHADLAMVLPNRIVCPASKFKIDHYIEEFVNAKKGFFLILKTINYVYLAIKRVPPVQMIRRLLV